MTNTTGYPLFEQWYKTADWILDKCDKMPKHTRFTINSRMANLTIEVLELITEAIYSKDRTPVLQRINMDLEKLRIFFRMAKDRRFISIAQYDFVSGELLQTGKMVGGWLRQQQSK